MKQNLWQREKAKPISKSVLKHGKHPSVTAIRKLKIRSIFEFAFASFQHTIFGTSNAGEMEKCSCQ